MSNELDADLGWFWYYWLWTTESVEGSIEAVATSGARTTVPGRAARPRPSAVGRAARAAAAHDFIAALPTGYDTEIGVAGYRTSGRPRPGPSRGPWAAAGR